MLSPLRKVFEEILAEAERRPEFGLRLAALLRQPAQDAVPQAPKRRNRNRRAPAPLDPFELFTHGEKPLREALAELDVDQLKDIVSEHAMDSSKLALKWHSTERLVELIVSTVRTRVAKGDAFKRGFVVRRGPGEVG